MSPPYAIRIRTADGWQDIALVGPQGPNGDPGPTGAAGPTGATGPGVPVGGTTGQVLAKKTAADLDTNWITAASGGGGGAGHTIQDEGISLTARSKLNFIGSGVTAQDDLANDATLVTVTSSVTMDTWHVVGTVGEPAFQNGWVNYDAAPYPPARFARFRKDPLGRVIFSGTIKSGTVGATIFTLPVGYRPATFQAIAIGASGADGVLNIGTDGTVNCNPGSAGFTFLDGAIFDTETVTAMPTGPQGPKGDTGGNATVPMDTWHIVSAAGEPAFYPGTGWKHYSAAYQQVGFHKDPLGRVWLKGLLGALNTISLSSPKTVFTLPAGYRPPLTVIFDTFYLGNYLARIDVQTDGQVVVNSVGGGPSFDVTGFTELDHLSFDTETVIAMPTGPKGDTGATGGNATVPMDTWHSVGAAGEPAFQNSWVNYAAGETTAGFRKDPLGKVMVRGVIKSGTVPSVAFTLPVGYRPPSNSRWPAVSNGVIAGFVQVDPNGNVSATGVNNTWVDLYGIDFDTDSVTAMPTGPTGAPGGQGITRLIGDGTATSFSIAHNFNQVNVNVAVYRTASPYDEIDCDVEHTDANTVTIRTFPTVPAGSEYTVAVSAAGTNTLAAVTMDSVHKIGAAGEPTFASPWVNFDNSLATPGGGTNRDVQFRKDPMGKVSLFGVIKGGSTGTAVFTLPVGYRPVTSDRTFAVGASGGAATMQVFGATGVVVASNLGASNVSAYCFLDGVEFDTETVLQTASVAAVPMDAWHTVSAAGEPGFQNSWVAHASLGKPRFRKYPDGRVRIAGALSKTTTPAAGEATFTLPAGYRPTTQQIYNVRLWNSGGAEAVGRFDINADGTVMYQAGATAGIGWLMLDGLEFDTETVGAYVSGTINQAYACAITGSVAIPVQGAGALAKMAINTVVLDSAGWWDSVNARYIPKVAGRYLVTAGYSGTVAGVGGPGLVDFAVFKNGGRVPSTGQQRFQMPATTWGGEFVITAQYVMNGTTDYLEMFGGAGSALAGNERLDICYLGAV